MIGQYFRDLNEQIGNGWNRFWFLPRDPYLLGLIRLLTGLVALYWYWTYYPDLLRLFGPDGLLPVEATQSWRMGRGFSLLDYFSTASELRAFYWTGFIAIVLFAAGVFARVTSVLALVVVLSFIQRAPMLATSVDDLLPMVMLYLCIGPSGAAWSVDALLWRRKERARAAKDASALSWSANIATRLLQVHLSAAYFMMAIAKMKVDLWWSGTAVWWIAAKSEPRLVDLTWLAGENYLYLVNFWTHAIVAFELAFALLIWNRTARPLMLLLAIPMWTATAVLTDQYLFSALILVANLSFAAPELARRLFGNCCGGQRLYSPENPA